MTTFEELLAGREIHELSNEEVKEIIDDLKTNPKELEKASNAVRKSRRKPSPTKRTQKRKKEVEDTVKTLLLKGNKA